MTLIKVQFARSPAGTTASASTFHQDDADDDGGNDDHHCQDTALAIAIKSMRHCDP